MTAPLGPMTAPPAEAAPLEPGDLPALFQAANRASVRAQSSYFSVLKWEMFMLILGALLGSLGETALGRWSLVGSVLTLLLGLCIALISRQRRYEQQWFNCRAISETVKSLSWRYVTRSPPLDQPSLKDADASFARAIADVLRDWKDRVSLAAENSGSPQRTAKMRDLRESPISVRLNAYRMGRLVDQQRWYGRRAQEHDRSEGRWFTLASLAQVAAVALAVFALALPHLPVRPIAVAATVASAAFAWSKARRFRELSSAYSLAAQELSVAEAEAEHVSSDEDLTKLVQEVEERISREHTTWRARSG